MLKPLATIHCAMPSDVFLHDHEEFPDLLRIVAEERGIALGLVEKDYWIMHSLYGLQQMGLSFELKGGTSLSKGFDIIHRFSEDIDIRIEPPADLDVKSGRNHRKPAHCESRKIFYNWLATTIKISGIEDVQRDAEFDEVPLYRSGGIRLRYKSISEPIEGLKEGILLEVGFDEVTPNFQKDISAWAYDKAIDSVDVIDNRAKGVACYHPGYTFVEKLQTISTKFRLQQASNTFPINFMRHYYDVYCLLQNPDVQAFIGTDKYQTHKKRRFRKDDNPVISKNEAFLLSKPETRNSYRANFELTKSLYYQSQPDFDEILAAIGKEIDRL